MHQQTTTGPLTEAIARLEFLLAMSQGESHWEIHSIAYPDGAYTAQVYFPVDWLHPDAVTYGERNFLEVHGDDLAATVAALADQLAAAARGAA